MVLAYRLLPYLKLDSHVFYFVNGRINKKVKCHYVRTNNLHLVVITGYVSRVYFILKTNTNTNIKTLPPEWLKPPSHFVIYACIMEIP